LQATRIVNFFSETVNAGVLAAPVPLIAGTRTLSAGAIGTTGNPGDGGVTAGVGVVSPGVARGGDAAAAEGPGSPPTGAGVHADTARHARTVHPRPHRRRDISRTPMLLVVDVPGGAVRGLPGTGTPGLSAGGTAATCTFASSRQQHRKIRCGHDA
jgi:hypothetical protein